MRRRQLRTEVGHPTPTNDNYLETKGRPKRNPIVLWGSIILNVLFLLHVIYRRYSSKNNQNLRTQPRKTTRLSHLNDESVVPIPRDSKDNILSLEERLRYLEMKFATRVSFGTKDPFVGSSDNPKACGRQSDLKEFGCTENHPYNGYSFKDCPGFFDHHVCLDILPPPNSSSKKKKAPPCLVYDFGVRDMPTFGLTMAQTFGCEIHAFDPSPVSVKWWNSETHAARAAILNDPEVSKLYHFHTYGSGGIDGTINLVDYDWGQVSLLRYPPYVVDCNQTDISKPCKVNPTNQQKAYPLEVKTLNTIRKELGHQDRIIDYLKIDVEGSEFAFLEQMLDTNGGCPAFIRQIGIEWHHFSVDSRYGEGSSGQVNAIVALLKSCGFELFWQWSKLGWKSGERIFHDLEMKDVRYNLASFIRKK